MLIARHFGEKFSATQCNEMCDHCKHSGEGWQQITHACEQLVFVRNEISTGILFS